MTFRRGGPKSVTQKSLKLLAFRHRWSDRQNSFTAPLTMTGGNFLARHARYGNGGAQRNRTEVQATTETARVSERVVRFAKFSHRTTPRDRRQLSSRPRGPVRPRRRATAIWPKSRPPRKTLVFSNAGFDSQICFTAGRRAMPGNFLAYQTVRAILCLTKAARNAI